MLSALILTAISRHPDVAAFGATPMEMTCASPMKHAHDDAVGAMALRASISGRMFGIITGKLRLIRQSSQLYADLVLRKAGLWFVKGLITIALCIVALLLCPTRAGAQFPATAFKELRLLVEDGNEVAILDADVGAPEESLSL